MLSGLSRYPASTVAAVAAITVAVVVLLRPLWLVVTQYEPGTLHARLGGHVDAEEQGPSAATSGSRGRRSRR